MRPDNTGRSSVGKTGRTTGRRGKPHPLAARRLLAQLDSWLVERAEEGNRP